MPPLPMFLIAPLAVTEDVTMEATTTVTLSIFSGLVFYLVLALLNGMFSFDKGSAN